ncbi:MAG: hypothetical protein RIS09_247 [Actinomycetota bacterium]
MDTPARDMHTFDESEANLVLAYVRERLELAEAPLDFPGNRLELEAKISGLITENGNDPKTILNLYADVIATTVLSTDSPRFLSFIPAAPTKAALLFDAVVSAASLQGMSWLEAAGALVCENQALRWISNLAGLPKQAGGTFVSGGSAANLSALAVARDIGKQKRNADRVRIAMSEQAHSSIGNSLRLLDVEPLILETDNDRLTRASIQRSLEKDSSSIPLVAIAATAGTTNAGIVDDLRAVAEICKEQDLWMHVDGAYGLAAILSPRTRDLFNGIEHADSVITDPHKWWFAPFDCAALIYKDPRLAIGVHTQNASYLDVLHDDLPVDQFNPTDVAYHLTRRARGLAFWYSLVVNGTKAYEDAVTASIQLARETSDYIKTIDHLELVREPSLSVVLWRRRGWGLADYQSFQDRLLKEQIGFVTPSKWHGEVVGRFAFLHPHTTFDMVKEILELTK